MLVYTTTVSFSSTAASASDTSTFADASLIAMLGWFASDSTTDTSVVPAATPCSTGELLLLLELVPTVAAAVLLDAKVTRSVTSTVTLLKDASPTVNVP